MGEARSKAEREAAAKQAQELNKLMQQVKPTPIQPKYVPSLLDAMKDGNEYISIVGLALDPAHPDLIPDIRKAIIELETIRNRPCVCYVANVVKDVPDTSIGSADHLPFNEMVANVAAQHRDVDVFLATPGGSAEQVALFVDTLRTRFDSVEFLIPDKAMSAGTLWALSGDKIWMDSRAYIGPIDPQIHSKDGRLVPAQALLTLLARIQDEGAEALKKGQQPAWSNIVLLKELDPKQLGAAISASQYVIKMAATFLNQYKFKTWTVHQGTGKPVTPAEREARAVEVAAQLCSHDKWKAHGHAINREAVMSERIKIDRPDAQLERAMRRLWALLYYTFDKSNTSKIILSREYSFAKTAAQTFQLQLAGV